MSADHQPPGLDQSVGYALRRTSNTLRTALEAALRQHGLTVPQYACLELLSRQPGMSSAQLARGAFVTRQATHQMLGHLLDAGLVARQCRSGSASGVPVALTPAGKNRLHAAAATVASVENRMLAPLAPARRSRLLADLHACADALIGHSGDPPAEAEGGPAEHG